MPLKLDIQSAMLVVTTALGVFTALSSREAAEKATEAQVAATATKTDLDIRAAGREDTRIDRDYQLKITDMVLNSIKEGNVAQQSALIGLVQTLPNLALAETLAAALRTSESKTVRAEATVAQTNITVEREYLRQEASDKRAAVRGPSAVAPPQAVGTTRVANAGGAGGFSFDIFYCQGPGDGPRISRANALSAALARAAAAGEKIGDESIGLVRVRPLPLLTNARPGYGITIDVVRPHRGSAVEAKVAKGLVALPQGASLGVQPVGQPSPRYISVFFCA